MKLDINKKIDSIALKNMEEFVIDDNLKGELVYFSRISHEYYKGGETFNQIKIETYDHMEYVFNFDNDQQCCEDFGYFHSFDIKDLRNFIGAKLKTIELSDDNSFIKFKTDKGDFNITIYNNHNGYYGHEVNFIIKGIL